MDDSRKNKFDSKDSLEIGLKAEEIFKNIAISKGFIVEKANPQQDMDEHWDYKLSKANSDSSCLVDVKARKRINRKDDDVQDEYTWLELHGVREDDKGWLSGGKANIIAFERKDDFLLVPIEKLRELVEKKVEKTFVEQSKDALYKCYQRKGRCDVLTFVKTADIEAIAVRIWAKLKS